MRAVGGWKSVRMAMVMSMGTAGAVGRQGGRVGVQVRGRRATRPVARREAVRCMAGDGLVQEVSGEALQNVLLGDRDLPMIIDFYADWCGPCQLLKPEFEKAAKELEGRCRFYKVDSDAEPEMSTALQIRGLPTLLFIPQDKGKPALRTEGMLPSEKIVEVFEEHVVGDTPPPTA